MDNENKDIEWARFEFEKKCYEEDLRLRRSEERRAWCSLPLLLLFIGIVPTRIVDDLRHNDDLKLENERVQHTFNSEKIKQISDLGKTLIIEKDPVKAEKIQFVMSKIVEAKDNKGIFLSYLNAPGFNKLESPSSTTSSFEAAPANYKWTVSDIVSPVGNPSASILTEFGNIDSSSVNLNISASGQIVSPGVIHDSNIGANISDFSNVTALVVEYSDSVSKYTNFNGDPALSVMGNSSQLTFATELLKPVYAVTANFLSGATGDTSSQALLPINGVEGGSWLLERSSVHTIAD